MFEELDETICVEDMTTRELGACFSTEFARIANGAQLILIDALKVPNLLSTLRVEAREAMALIVDTPACMTAPVILLAKGSSGNFLFLHRSVSVDHKDHLLLVPGFCFWKLKCK